MNQSAQERYYDQHYSIFDVSAWQAWKPKPIFTEKKNLSDFRINFWQQDGQEAVLATLANFAPFKSVLDFGCSAGDFLIPLSRVSTRTYGIDIVDFSIVWESLKHEYGINFQTLNIDCADLPFEDSSFDLVTMMAVLEHVFDVHHAVKETSRILSVGGIAVIQVPNIAYIKHRLDILLGRLPCTSNTQTRDNRTEWDGQHLHYFTLETLGSLLEQYGLQVQKVMCSGKLARVRWLWSSLLGADLIVFAKKTLN